MNNTEIENENENENDYRALLFDDCDSDSNSDVSGVSGVSGVNGVNGVNGGLCDYDVEEGILDTRWISEYERQFIDDEYRLFLKTDITRVSVDFYYLDHNKSYVQDVLSIKYSLQNINQISQNELFSIIRRHQHLDKKYYNFQTLLLYSIDFQDNNGKDVTRALAQYIQEPTFSLKSNQNNNSHFEKKTFIEYTNLLSIDVIYLKPIITMFHEFIGFSVLLYED